MKTSEIKQIQSVGVSFDLIACPVGSRGWVVFCRTSTGFCEELMSARGHRRFFVTLDAVHNFAKSVGCDEVIIRESLWNEDVA